MVILLLATANIVAAQTSIPSPLLHWRPAAGDSSLNHNPAVLGGGIAIDSLPYSSDYTMIVVYKPVRDSEATVWSLGFAAGGTRGLTTERILSDSTSIRYREQTGLTPAISTLRQSAPDSVSPYAGLAIGGGLKVAEVLYYGTRLGNAALRGIQSVLAVRYGITLGPVDWRIGGATVWDYDSVYRFRVTGVGTDTASRLFQTVSRSEMDSALLTIAADTLADRMFLLAGDDGGAPVFETVDSAEYFGRTWKVQATGLCDAAFTLAFDTRGFASSGDTLALLVDGDVYGIAVADSGRAVFGNVVFGYCDTAAGGTSVHYMTLGRGSSLVQDIRQRSKQGVVPGGVAASIYPNPSSGRYTLEVSGAGQVQVIIYNAQGSVVREHSSEECRQCRFEGELPTGNVYYATVATSGGTQTLKLVVK